MFNLPNLIGHRGVKNLSPENTLESIKLAKFLGLSWVEVDVKVSKDLVPILLHDDTLDRTTNGEGLPIEIDYDNLKKLDAGNFFYNKPTPITIPTLEEVLFFCSENSMGINIEIKSNLGFEEENIESIFKTIRKFNIKNRFYFSSFDWDSIILMKKLMPKAFYSLLIDDFNKNISIKSILDFCSEYKIDSCGFNKNLIDNEIIKILKNKNLIITVYSEDNFKKDEAIDLWSKGIKSIFIDDPTEFKLINL